jgi:hypothetical protein
MPEATASAASALPRLRDRQPPFQDRLRRILGATVDISLASAFEHFCAMLGAIKHIGRRQVERRRQCTFGCGRIVSAMYGPRGEAGCEVAAISVQQRNLITKSKPPYFIQRGGSLLLRTHYNSI